MSVQSSNPPAAADWASRQGPRLGGFNATVLRLEIRRVLRNRRTLLMTVVLPIFFFVIFGVIQTYDNSRVGPGNVSAYILISMALYGAVLATTSGGAMVSIERAQGWSRQLRITPLSPVAYVAIKLVTALVLGATAVAGVYVVGALSGKPSMPVHLWVGTALIVWVGSLVFAAFGLFMGYLLPTENVMQVLGFGLVLLSFLAGLFIPLSQFPQGYRDFAQFTPLYGLSKLVHAPLVGGTFEWKWVINAVLWLVIFTAGAVWRFRKDTARV
jgi:ABC-2 type transport system permease protein